MKNLDKLKKDYNEIEIPDELEDIVKSAIQQGKRPVRKKRYWKQWATGAVAASALFVGSINLSPAFAQTMANVPVLGSIVDVFTGQQWKVDEGTYQADLKTPALEGLSNKELQESLNAKYIAENKALYDQFEQEVAALDEMGGGHTGVASGYNILTDTEQLLAIGRYEENIVGSSSTVVKYDTVDKQNGILITLPSLFNNGDYVEIISQYLLNEMREQMAADENVIYFLPESEFGGFEHIRPDQSFYITKDNKLVLSFDKYEVAPGYMGVLTFEIPTDLIKDELVSDLYVK